jgi:hypothetical protein
LERAARWQGVLPTVAVPDAQPGSPHLTLDSVAEALAVVRELRQGAGLPWEGYDVVAEGVSDPATADEQLREWVDAGATWWVESDWSMGEDAVARHRARIDAGPPAP